MDALSEGAAGRADTEGEDADRIAGGSEGAHLCPTWVLRTSPNRRRAPGRRRGVPSLFGQVGEDNRSQPSMIITWRVARSIDNERASRHGQRHLNPL